MMNRGSIIITEDQYLGFNSPRVFLLKDIYDHDVFCPQYHPELKSMIDTLIASGEMESENTLFSRPEQDYLNFMLNRSKFSNGLDLRNRYLHGTYSHQSENQQMQDYIHFLNMMILIIGKIYEEFALREKQNHST